MSLKGIRLGGRVARDGDREHDVTVQRLGRLAGSRSANLNSKLRRRVNSKLRPGHSGSTGIITGSGFSATVTQWRQPSAASATKRPRNHSGSG